MVDQKPNETVDEPGWYGQLVRAISATRVNVVIVIGLGLGLTMAGQSRDLLLSIASDALTRWWVALASLAGLILFTAVIGLTSYSLMSRKLAGVSEKTATYMVGALMGLSFLTFLVALWIAIGPAVMANWWLGLKGGIITLAAMAFLLLMFYLIPSGQEILRNLQARAIEKAREARERVARLQILTVTTSPTSGAIDISAILQRVAQFSLGITSAHAFSVWIAGIIAVGISFLVLPNWMGYAQWVGAIAVVYQSAAGWCLLINSFIFIARERRVPVLVIATVLFLACGILDINDNHEVRRIPVAVEPLDSTQEALRKWLLTPGRGYEKGKPFPLFIVAAEGGGIRNAYWTTAVLCRLRDSYPEFEKHLFAISGVSGGSVGASVYAALVSQQSALPHRTPISGEYRKVLGQDLLSPVLSKGLTHDLAYQFLPVSLTRVFGWVPEDRAIVLERSLESAWRNAGLTGKPLEEGFYGLRQGTNVAAVPLLVLNTTEVSTGERVPIGHFIPDTSPGVDGGQSMKMYHDLTGQDIPLSTAAFLSARFPVVTPAGTVTTASGATRLVDGGYFENSATYTVRDMIRELITNPPAPRDKAWEQVDLGDITIHVIVIRYMELGDGQRTNGRGAFGEPLSPVRAMLTTREARAGLSRRALAQLMEDTMLLRAEVVSLNGSPGQIELGEILDFGVMPEQTGLPLGWVLSRGAQDGIDSAMPGPGGVPMGTPGNRALFQRVGDILTEAHPVPSINPQDFEQEFKSLLANQVAQEQKRLTTEQLRDIPNRLAPTTSPSKSKSAIRQQR